MQECTQLPCDHGTDDARILKEEFGDKIDASLVYAGWTNKAPGTRFAADVEKLMARGKDARKWLRDFARKAGDDAHIVVTSHGGFLHFVNNDWTGTLEGSSE